MMRSAPLLRAAMLLLAVVMLPSTGVAAADASATAAATVAAAGWAPTVDWTAFQQLAPNESYPAPLFDNFGSAFALAGNGQTLVVAASSGEDTTNISVIVYTRDGSGSWASPRPLLYDATNYGRVQDVALSYDGSILFAGASGFGAPNQSVLVYTRSAAGEWSLHQNILPPPIWDPTNYGHTFGVAVAANKDASLLAVTDQYAEFCGLVHVFERTNSSSGSLFGFLQTLHPPSSDCSELLEYGSEIRFSENGQILVVSAPDNTSVAVYGRGGNSGLLTLQQSLVVGIQSSGVSSLDLSAAGDVLVVSSDNIFTDAGEVWTYARNHASGLFEQVGSKLVATGVQPDCNSDGYCFSLDFGTRLAISVDGTHLLVSANGATGNDKSKHAVTVGATLAYVRDMSASSTWTLQSVVQIRPQVSNLWQASALAISSDNSQIMMGIPQPDEMSAPGAVFIANMNVGESKPADGNRKRRRQGRQAAVKEA